MPPFPNAAGYLLTTLMLCMTSASVLAASAPMRAAMPTANMELRTNFLLPELNSGMRLIQLGSPTSQPGTSIEPIENEAAFGRINDAAAAFAVSKPATWQAVEGGWVTHMKIGSQGAIGLRTGLLIAPVAYPVEIRYQSADTEAPAFPNPVIALPASSSEGESTSAGLHWTGWTYGDGQIIEIFARTSEMPDKGLINLHGVSHGTRDPFGLLQSQQKATPLSCNVDVACSTDPVIANAARSVARFVITDNTGRTFSCTGALVSNQQTTDRLFVTSLSCGLTNSPDSNNTSTAQFYWGFQKSTCGGSTIAPGSFSTIGSTLLSADRANNIAVLRLLGNIPSDAFFLGWTTDAPALNSTLTTIYHPFGEAKKVTVGTLNALNRMMTVGDNILPALSDRITWSSGITEPGSEGAPLINSSGQLVGVLTFSPSKAGEALCAPGSTGRYAIASQFRSAFPRLLRWLRPLSIPVDDFPNSLAAAVTSTPLNGIVNGAINSATDEDWFQFDFPQPGQWMVYTERYDPAVRVSLTNKLFDDSGRTQYPISTRDPFQWLRDGNFLGLLINSASSATVKLQLTGVSGATGQYSLTSMFMPRDDHSNFPMIATTGPLPGLFNGNLETEGDIDYFRFDVSGPTVLVMETSGTTDTFGILRDGLFRKLVENDDIDAAAGNRNFRITARLPSEGSYYLGIRGAEPGMTGAYRLTVTQQTPAVPKVQGAWWGGATQNGWGLSFIQHGNTLVAGWYLYDSNGNPTWLTMPGCQWDALFTQCSGRVMSSVGSWLGDYAASQFRTTDVGSVTFRFSDDNQGTMLWNVNGFGATVPISKLAFGSGTQPTATNYTDVWWGGTSQNGWGIAIIQEGAQLAGAWYSFSRIGTPVWYLFNGGTWTTPTTHTANLYMSTGSRLIGGTYDANRLVTTQAGTVTFNFTGPGNGTMTYTVDGVTQTKAIERLAF